MAGERDAADQILHNAALGWASRVAGCFTYVLLACLKGAGFSDDEINRGRSQIEETGRTLFRIEHYHRCRHGNPTCRGLRATARVLCGSRDEHPEGHAGRERAAGPANLDLAGGRAGCGGDGSGRDNGFAAVRNQRLLWNGDETLTNVGMRGFSWTMNLIPSHAPSAVRSLLSRAT